MEVHIIVASINVLENIKAFETILGKHDYKIIVVDEGDEGLREKSAFSACFNHDCATLPFTPKPYTECVYRLDVDRRQYLSKFMAIMENHYK